MSLKYKLSLLISLLFVVSGVASVLVNRLLIIPSFVELERQQAQRNVERAIEAIHRDLDVLSTNVTAWAWWDDSRHFMLGTNDEFIEAELSAEPVASAEVSYMGFYRTDGRQVIHRAPAAAEPGSPGFGELQATSLPSTHPLLLHADLRGDAHGLLRTPQGPMLVASRPILSSSGEGPAAGVLIFGRLFDEATVKRIAGQYKLDLTIAPVDTSAEPIRMDVRPEEGPPSTSVQLLQDEHTTRGLATIADIHGVPLFTLQVATPRKISAYGEQASHIALLILCAVALAVLGVLLTLIHVMVLRPIGRITAHAVSVGGDDTLDKRMQLGRTDELGALAAEFDRMTDRLADARHRLIEQSFVSGKADMAAGILHNLGNAVTPITVRLDALADRIKAAPLDDLQRAVEELDRKTAAPERHADLVRFVQLAGLDLASLMRDVKEDVSGVGAQVEHVQQILAEQERYSHAARVVETVDMEQVVRQAADGLSPELQRSLTVEIDPSVRTVGMARGLRVEIQQVVGNLILNAAESIRSQGTEKGHIRVWAYPELMGGVPVGHFTFADNGVGIQPWHLKRIFDRRFSTKDRGSGLGLHWSANAVSALGGRLYAESEGVGAGARLHLVLPLAPDASAATPAAVSRSA